jgi:hypothetical protein
MTDGTAPRNRGSMLAERLSDVDLVALSDVVRQTHANEGNDAVVAV